MNSEITVLAPFYSPGAQGHHGAYPIALAKEFMRLSDRTQIFCQSNYEEDFIVKKIGFASVRPGPQFINARLILNLLFTRTKNRIVYFGEGTLETAFQLALSLVNPRLSLVILVMSLPKTTISLRKREALNAFTSTGRLKILADGPLVTQAIERLGINVSQSPLYSLAPSSSGPMRNAAVAGKKHLRIYFVARYRETIEQFLQIESELCKQCEYLVHPPNELTGKIRFQLAKEAPRELSSSNYFSFVASLDRAVVIYPASFVNVSAKALDALRLGVEVVVQKNTATSFALEQISQVNCVDFADRTDALRAFSHFVDEKENKLSNSVQPISVEEYARYILGLTTEKRVGRIPIRSLVITLLNYGQKFTDWVLKTLVTKFFVN